MMLRRFFTGLCYCTLAGSPSLAQRWGTRPDGSRPATLAGPHTRAVVLFFVASDCPVSNRTFPEMHRLREAFSGRDVHFVYVYPNTTETAPEAAAHQQLFDAGGDVLLDPKGSLVRLSHAVATPEMAVLVPAAQTGWHPVYTGKVDDRYVRLGLERPQATRHFGQEALEAVLTGKIPQPSPGQPVGCAIMSPGLR